MSLVELHDLSEIDYKRRRTGIRHEHKLLLIVCAGTTEEVYLNNFRKRDIGFKIHVRKCQVTDPESVVAFAINRMSDLGLDVADGDLAFCVFDMDGNTPQNLKRATQTANQNGIVLIPSNPCFEVWYLLHFRYSDAQLTNFSQVKAELESYLPGYEKTKNYYSLLADKTSTAIANARKLNSQNGVGDSSTQVVVLLERLLEILNA